MRRPRGTRMNEAVCCELPSYWVRQCSLRGTVEFAHVLVAGMNLCKMCQLRCVRGLVRGLNGRQLSLRISCAEAAVCLVETHGAIAVRRPSPIAALSGFMRRAVTRTLFVVTGSMSRPDGFCASHPRGAGSRRAGCMHRRAYPRHLARLSCRCLVFFEVLPRGSGRHRKPAASCYGALWNFE